MNDLDQLGDTKHSIVQDARRLREHLRQWHEESDRRHAAWRTRGFSYPAPESVSFPRECIGMECGAKSRAGTPCKRRDLFRNGRCRLHGGMSTGPRTSEGKSRSAMNAKKTNPMGT